jgi:hypothetical protein
VDTSIQSEGTRIRLIRPDAGTIEQFAVVEVAGIQRRAHMLAVAAEGPDGWALEAFHNMLPFDPEAG